MDNKYPLDYYLNIFAREAVIDASGRARDGLSQELITAVYHLATDKADMTRMCRALRKYQINTLQKLKEVEPEVILNKWRNVGKKTAEKFIYLQSLPVEDEQEIIVRRYCVNALECQIDAMVKEAYMAGANRKDMPSFNYEECLKRSLFDIK